MLQGLYSAAAGMAAQQQRIDGVSNDLANISTPGYKGVRVGFRDLLYNSQGDQAGETVTAGAGSAASFIGRSQQQGAVLTTDQPLDVSIEGSGFFQLRRADGGIALTRDGSFRLDPLGRVTSSDGLLLSPPVTVPRNTPIDRIAIGADGTVRVNDGQQIGRIQLVTVTSPDGLRALGDNRFAVTPESGAATATNGATLRQGTLEGSNVDMSDAMVDMMNAQRAFQLASRAIHMQDQMLEVANQVKR
ncbi:flagellar hook-basal body protein [Conexibacter woesei]|uniref:Flagellar hook-basal body protein n=1 Tax=Conexibacter woesei (strain DSM 14684 / CCUG 47730 / CIP 108061 / JCM 11494 / NBRC 100937 / ID131577) TaxID=469383 RepID=D3F3X8_CONWI|nr:flagellar hook-basal body protein [Conexibacter woesei]ADB48461.1 flagellar hook-basal body protein [Conexibacter woesei DSM 14684]